jgi:hypothetical protein
MPKNTSQRIIDARTVTSGAVFSGGAGGGSTGVTDHGALTGLAGDDHGQYHTDARGDARYVPLARTVTAGTGLSGGGALSGDITVTLPSAVAGAGLTYSTGVVAVGAGLGLTVNADDVALTTPGTVTVSSTNAASGSHTHAITSSSNPGAAASILATDASGHVAVVKVRTPTIDTASGDLALNPAGVVDLYKAIQADNYASQTTGWRATYDGQADFRYLYTDELHAKSFIADLEQALAGGQIISKSVAMLFADVTMVAASASVVFAVRDLPSAPNMAVFQAGDIVRFRTFTRSAGSLIIADAWGIVNGYTDGTTGNGADGGQFWTFTRSAAPNAGTMSAGTVVAADSIILDYGTTGNGFHEVNAIDGAYGANSPYSQIVTWSTHPATGQTVRTRLGNLYGVTAQSGEYGLWAGSGTANTDSYLRVSSWGARFNNIPITLYSGGTQTVNINSSGTDIWVGPSSSDKRLEWNGTTLTITGTATIKGGATVTTSGAGLYFGADKFGYYDGTNWKAHIDNSIGLTLPVGSTSSVDNGSIRFRSGSTDKGFIKAYSSGGAEYIWYQSGVHFLSPNVYIGGGSTGTNYLRVFDTNSADPALYVDAANKRVGIGTSSMSVALQVSGDIRANNVHGTVDNTGITFGGGTTSSKGAYVTLYGKDHATVPGWFQMVYGSTATWRVVKTDFASANTVMLAMDSSGNITTPDEDAYYTLGRARVGYYASFTDTAVFAHRDRTDSGDYSLAQNSSGKTVINSASGQTIDFRINNVNVASVDTTDWDFVGAVTTQKYVEFTHLYSGLDGPGGVAGKLRLFWRDTGSSGKYELRWVTMNTGNTAERGGVIFDNSEGADLP